MMAQHLPIVIMLALPQSVSFFDNQMYFLLFQQHCSSVKRYCCHWGLLRLIMSCIVLGVQIFLWDLSSYIHRAPCIIWCWVRPVSVTMAQLSAISRQSSTQLDPQLIFCTCFSPYWLFTSSYLPKVDLTAMSYRFWSC